jgi:hypothetical protein
LYAATGTTDLRVRHQTGQRALEEECSHWGHRQDQTHATLLHCDAEHADSEIATMDDNRSCMLSTLLSIRSPRGSFLPVTPRVTSSPTRRG